MDFISSWSGLISLTFLLITPAATIAATSTNKRKTRSEYFLSLAATIAIGGVAHYAIRNFVDPHGWLAVMGYLLAGLGLAVYLITATVHRLQDCGWSRWNAFLYAIPLINFALFVTLCLVPGKGMRPSGSMEKARQPDPYRRPSPHVFHADSNSLSNDSLDG